MVRNPSGQPWTEGCLLTDENQTALTSRDVIGWITYTSRKTTEVVPNCGFVPVVLGPNWFGALPDIYPNYVGAVPLDASDQDVLERGAETRAQEKQKDVPPTGRLD